MKHLLFSTCIALCSLFAVTSGIAQTPCTDCPSGTTVSTAPVDGSIILINQTFPGLSTCTFTVYVRFDSNRCDGVLHMNVEHYMLQPTSFCQYSGSVDCGLTKLMVLKLITLHFNEPILFSTNWDCCTTVELDLSSMDPTDDCFSNPSTPQQGQIGYLSSSCGTAGCCRAIFTPIGGGLVQYSVFESTSGNCPSLAFNTPFDFVLICDGVLTSFPVIQKNYPCYQGCPLGASGVFKDDLERGAIEAVDGSAQVNVFPNPASDQLNLTFAEGTPENSLVEVYDLQGKRVIQTNVNQNGGQNVSIGLSDLSTGTYILRITNKESVIHNQTFEVIR